MAEGEIVLLMNAAQETVNELSKLPSECNHSKVEALSHAYGQLVYNIRDALKTQNRIILSHSGDGRISQAQQEGEILAEIASYQSKRAEDEGYL